MPFKSKTQAAKCFALKRKGQAGSWDCSEWAEKTDFASIPKSKEASMSNQRLARVKQAASMLFLQPLFQKVADDFFNGNINEAVGYCNQHGVHPAAIVKAAAGMSIDPDTFNANERARVGKHLAEPGGRSYPMNNPGIDRPGPVGDAPTLTKRPMVDIARRVNVQKMPLLKLLGRNKLLAGGAAAATGLAGLGMLGRSMRGSPAEAGGGDGVIPPAVAGGGGGGGPTAASGGGGGMSPAAKALLALGLAGGGAYGLSRAMGGKKKKKEAGDADFATRVLRRVVTKKASALLREHSVAKVNSYLDKVASDLSTADQTPLRMIQAGLSAGKNISTAIKLAFPKMAAEARGVLAAEIVKKAAAN